MSFFNRTKDKLKDGVESAKWKADQVLRIQKVHGEIGEVKRKISDIYNQIVSVTIDLHQRGLLTQEELEKLCQTIDSYKGEIIAKEARIEEIKRESPPVPVPYPQVITAHKVCPVCREKISDDATFCTNCGSPISNPEPAHGDIEPALTIQCSNCGHDLPFDAVFCNECGTPVGLHDSTGDLKDELP